MRVTTREELAGTVDEVHALFTDRAFQEALARKAVEEEWSVRAVEEAVRARGGAAADDEASTTKDDAGSGGTGERRLRPTGLLELEELLSGYLDTRVAVKMGGKRGKVIIEFATLEDLERIYRRVTDQG